MHAATTAGAARAATQPQLRVIDSLAQRRQLDLERLLVDRCGNSEAKALSMIDVSRLIDDLRSMDNEPASGRVFGSVETRSVLSPVEGKPWWRKSNWTRWP